MKPTLALAALLTLSPLALHAQTDAMPPETKAPAPKAMESAPHKLIAPAISLTVFATFDGKEAVYSIDDLKALPQQTVKALNGHTNKTETFTGPLVADIFKKAGLVSDDKTHSLILNSFVTAYGTDGYHVVYALSEMEPTFTSGKVIVALTVDGKPVESGLQLVNPLDTKPARWVQAVTKLIVHNVVDHSSEPKPTM